MATWTPAVHISFFLIDLVHLYNQSYMVDLSRAQPKLTFHLFDNLILIC